MSSDPWPLYSLCLTTPRLQLRPPTDDEYVSVCEVAERGVHDPGTMPFSEEWTDAPGGELTANAFRFLWHTRADWTPQSWHLEFAVFLDGQPIGMKGIWADQFAITREFATGSWLGRAYQGQGYGTEARAAVLHLCFRYLGARWANSQAYEDNMPSRRLNERLGYHEDGFDIRVRRGQAARWMRYRLAAHDWVGRHGLDGQITVAGFDACRDMFCGTGEG
jgi:RimJ/RimL family protein N-acetyltransferase